MKVLVVKSRMLRVLGTMAFISGAKWVKGKFGAALEFNGDGDQVLVAHNDALNIGLRDRHSFTAIRTYSCQSNQMG